MINLHHFLYKEVLAFIFNLFTSTYLYWLASLSVEIMIWNWHVLLAACKFRSHWWKIMIYSYKGVIYRCLFSVPFQWFWIFWCGDNVWNNITNKLVSSNDEYSFMKSGTHPLNLWWRLKLVLDSWWRSLLCQIVNLIHRTSILYSDIIHICHNKKYKENHILVVIGSLLHFLCTLWHYFLTLGEVVYLGTCI